MNDGSTVQEGMQRKWIYEEIVDRIPPFRWLPPDPFLTGKELSSTSGRNQGNSYSCGGAIALTFLSVMM